MTSDNKRGWNLKYYAGNNRAFYGTSKSVDGKTSATWPYIIPFNKFNPDNIEESLKYNIVNN